MERVDEIRLFMERRFFFPYKWIMSIHHKMCLNITSLNVHKNSWLKTISNKNTPGVCWYREGGVRASKEVCPYPYSRSILL